MGLFDRLFGTEQQDAPRPPQRPRTDDEIAVERYRYLLRTAPPEAIERVHAEAFAKLTDEQRAMIFEELTKNAPRAMPPAVRTPSLSPSRRRAPSFVSRHDGAVVPGPQLRCDGRKLASGNRSRVRHRFGNRGRVPPERLRHGCVRRHGCGQRRRHGQRRIRGCLGRCRGRWRIRRWLW